MATEDKLKLLKDLQKAMKSAGLDEAKDVTIVRQGTQITLPENMDYDEAITWLRRKQEEEEKEVGINYELPGYPLDAAVCFFKALAEIFGWTDLRPTPGFFGPKPPIMIGIPVGLNQTIEVPWGSVAVPSLDGMFTTVMHWEPVPKLVIGGKMKRKHIPQVAKVIDTAKRIWRENSIYRGNAIRVSWAWKRDGASFDPTENAPKYMDLAAVNESDIVFPEKVQDSVNIGLFAPIEFSAAFRKNKIPLKRGILLEGPYGVGKTLTANVTALKATKNKWTFIYCNSILDLREAVRLGAQYAPAVLFAEDIDRVVKGQRSVEMDDLLNVLDGVESKHMEVITILTTNHVENLNRAILRPGRLDTVVSLQPPDPEAATRLVKLYGRGLLEEGTDLEKVGEQLQGKIPAFIREVVERAKIAAVARTNGGDIKGHVSGLDIMRAAVGMEDHAKLMKEKEVTGAEFKLESLKLRVENKHMTPVVTTNGDGEEEEE